MSLANNLFITYTTGAGNFFFTPARNIGTLNPYESTVKETSVWQEYTSDTSAPLIFITPELIEPDVLPANHPLWDEVDSLLEEIWAKSEYVSPEEDAAWLDEIRSAGMEDLEDLFGNSDSWE
jgi:hypothetical protein